MATDESTLLSGRVRLVQPLDGFRSGLDAVLLASAAPVTAGQTLLDLGAHVGAVGLCVLARVPGVQLTGLELDPALVTYATMNAALNGWPAAQVHFVAGDVRTKNAVPANHFDHVVCNPPYYQSGAWSTAKNAGRARALGAVAGDAHLGDWIACAYRALVPRGYLTLIHRADQLDQIIQALGPRFGALEVWPIHSFAEEAASRVIVRARKDRKTGLTLQMGLIMHDDNKAWTPHARAILEAAAPLVIG